MRTRDRDRRYSKSSRYATGLHTIIWSTFGYRNRYWFDTSSVLCRVNSIQNRIQIKNTDAIKLKVSISELEFKVQSTKTVRYFAILDRHVYRGRLGSRTNWQ